MKRLALVAVVFCLLLGTAYAMSRDTALAAIAAFQKVGVIDEIVHDPNCKLVRVTKEWYNLTMNAKQAWGNMFATAYPGSCVSVKDAYTDKRLMMVTKKGHVKMY